MALAKEFIKQAKNAARNRKTCYEASEKIHSVLYNLSQLTDETHKTKFTFGMYLSGKLSRKLVAEDLYEEIGIGFVTTDKKATMN